MEVLIDACFAEGAETFIDCMRVAEKARADRTLQKWVQSLFLNLLYMGWQVLHCSVIASAIGVVIISLRR